MRCPFELPVKKKPDFNNKDLFRVESADGLFLSFSLKENEADYIVQAINCHEKLAKLLKDAQRYIRPKDPKDPKYIEIEQALKEAEQE